MKIKISFLLLFISAGIGSLFAQKQNNIWINNKATWDFNNTASGDFAYTSNPSSYTTQSVSVASDKTTGNMLFYTNGVEVYTKNHTVMTNGNELFGTSYPNYSNFDMNLHMHGGIFSAQGSMIVPVPGSNSEYYVFSLAGDANNDDDLCYHTPFKYGLRYAKVDMSANAGIGTVTTKNNVIFTNANTNVMTSCPSNDGNFWLITQNDAGNYLSYKITASGISSPIVSSQAYDIARDGIKVSPNNALLFDITGRNLYTFNNATGTVVFNRKISVQSAYVNPKLPCSADFSEDSNVIYFISGYFTLGTASKSSESYYLCKYIISGNQLYGFTGTGEYFVKPVPPSSLQRHTNGKIYLKTYGKSKNYNYNTYNYSPAGSWYRLVNTNSTALDFNNFEAVNISPNINSGYTFPQLLPVAGQPENTCPDVLYITVPVSANQNFQASKSIFASSAVNNQLIVNYKAGLNVDLNPGFSVNAVAGSMFQAYISPCTISNFVYPDRLNENGAAFAKGNAGIASEVKIYPNPSSTVVKIDSGNNKVISWTLYDLSGKNIMNGSEITVPVQNLPKSAYLLMLRLDNGKTVSKKIVVQ